MTGPTIRMKNWRSWLRAVAKLERLTIKAGPDISRVARGIARSEVA